MRRTRSITSWSLSFEIAMMIAPLPLCRLVMTSFAKPSSTAATSSSRTWRPSGLFFTTVFANSLTEVKLPRPRTRISCARVSVKEPPAKFWLLAAISAWISASVTSYCAARILSTSTRTSRSRSPRSSALRRPGNRSMRSRRSRATSRRVKSPTSPSSISAIITTGKLSPTESSVRIGVSASSGRSSARSSAARTSFSAASCSMGLSDSSHSITISE